MLTEFLILIKWYATLIIILTAYKTPSSCKSLSLPDVNKKNRLINFSLYQYYYKIITQNMIKPPLPNTCIRSLHPKALCKADEMLSANSSQHCWMLHVASVGTPCCMLLRCCCVLLGVVSQTLKLVKLCMCI